MLGQSPSPTARPRASAWLAVAAVVLVAAFAFQGTRGIWEPDEGFYTNVALGMVRSGDWVVPRLNGEPFLDKPPLHYWSMAGAMAHFGVDEWAARTPHALWFTGTALLVGALAGRWWGRRAGLIAAGVYAGSLGPFLAANVLTPDTPLAFAVALAAYTYWRLEEEVRPGRRLGWGVAFGAALGLGAMAKGPATLVFAAPLVLHAMIRRRSPLRLFEPGFLAAGATALAVAVPWYAVVAGRLPGGLAYMLDNQVTGRLVTEDYARNAQWYGGLAVYLPTLLVGALPWSAVWPFVCRRRLRRLRRLRGYGGGVPLLLLLAVVVPLAVLVTARSRLPLYVLPLFAPLALVSARRLSLIRPATSRAAARCLVWLPVAAGAWLCLLIGVKALAGSIERPEDTRGVADSLRRQGVPPSQLLVTVDTKRNGLAFYGYHRLEQVTMSDRPYPFFVLPETLGEEAREIREGEARPVLLVPDRRASAILDFLSGELIRTRRRPIGHDLSLVEVDPAPAGGSSPAAPAGPASPAASP